MSSVVVDRKGTIVEAGSLQDSVLEGLYGHVPGRILVRLLASPALSGLAGAFLDSRLSRALIPWFIRSHSIDMGDYERKEYSSYNDFFTRRLAPGARRLDPCQTALVSPCDSRLTVYHIDNQCEFTIKHTRYTVQSLLRDYRLAARYAGGYVWVFRLCVEDYHLNGCPISGFLIKKSLSSKESVPSKFSS